MKEKHGIQSNLFHYATLINAHAKNLDEKEISRIMETINDAGLDAADDKVVFTCIIDNCAKRFYDAEALPMAERWFRKMLDYDVPADRQTYNAMLFLSKYRDLEKFVFYAKMMADDENVEMNNPKTTKHLKDVAGRSEISPQVSSQLSRIINSQCQQ
eukprot:jgi/Bigna1/145051/aug1.94_g19759